MVHYLLFFFSSLDSISMKNGFPTKRHHVLTNINKMSNLEIYNDLYRHLKSHSLLVGALEGLGASFW